MTRTTSTIDLVQHSSWIRRPFLCSSFSRWLTKALGWLGRFRGLLSCLCVLLFGFGNSFQSNTRTIRILLSSIGLLPNILFLSPLGSLLGGAALDLQARPLDGNLSCSSSSVASVTKPRDREPNKSMVHGIDIKYIHIKFNKGKKHKVP